MQKDILEASIKGIVPTSNGSALFLSTVEKVITIYIDPAMGKLIEMSLNNQKKERPLTHDLIDNVFKGFQIDLERVIINHVNEGTFYARIILKMENELGIKLLEIDARPTDAIILALNSKKSIYIARKVLDSLEDMSEVLNKIFLKP